MKSIRPKVSTSLAIFHKGPQEPNFSLGSKYVGEYWTDFRVYDI